MQVPKIRAALPGFRDWLASEDALAYRALFETQQNWQTHFNVEAADLAASYDAALDSKTNRRHYRRGGAYDPKSAMLALMRWQPDFVRDAFRDLFSEERDLEGRIQRFVFYVNELFNRFRDDKPKAKIPTHNHDDDYGIISIYLMGQYPATYAPYSTTLLQQVCTVLGAKDSPPAADFPRYTKLLRTLRQFLEADEEIMTNYRALLREQDYQGESALLTYLFFLYLTRSEAAETAKTT